jgi:DNA-binding MarR family transcriptional regulator
MTSDSDTTTPRRNPVANQLHDGSAPTDSGVVRATDWPGDRSSFALGLLLHRAHQRAVEALQGAIRPLGLELRHFAVLMTLNREGPLTQQQLVAACGSEKTTMVRTVDYLEHHQLVIRGPHVGDRRAHTVTMTARGLEIFDAAHANAADISRTLTGHLNAREVDSLIDVLTRFTYPNHAQPERYTPLPPHRSG